jgi:RNA polymerase sigma-70 factor (ECF subfamily)
MSVKDSFDEIKILYELSHGNERAFTALYNKYKNIVYSLALKITKSKTLSEEVVQDVFLKIWQKKDELKDIGDFESYLFISGRNHIFNIIKKMAKEENLKKNIGNSDLSSYATDSFLEDEQYTLLLNQILLKLPPQQQKIYQMAKVEGLSHQNIAEILDISPLTVKKHMALALKIIRIQLARHINIFIISFSYFFTQN